MVKSADSNSPMRPLHKSSEGKTVTLKGVKIVTAGHVSSLIMIGPNPVRISNKALREAAGDPDL